MPSGWTSVALRIEARFPYFAPFFLSQVIRTGAGQAGYERPAMSGHRLRSKEMDMNRNLRSSLIFTGTAAAAFALAAMAGAAYADDITIDPTPFVSTKTRAEVQAEVLGHVDEIRMANGEGAPEMNRTPFHGTLTRAQVRDEYLASREQVSAFNGEDSGSAYMTAMQSRADRNLMLAGSQR